MKRVLVRGGPTCQRLRQAPAAAAVVAGVWHGYLLCSASCLCCHPSRTTSPRLVVHLRFSLQPC